MKTLTPKNECIKQKSGEITRFLQCMEELGLRVADVAEMSGVAERTIKNTIWNDTPLNGDVLRNLHLKKGVSLNWLVSGVGPMLINTAADRAVDQASGPARAACLLAFVEEWANTRTPDELVWLDIQIQRAVPEYAAFIGNFQVG